jgi:hypothetical protein
MASRTPLQKGHASVGMTQTQQKIQSVRFYIDLRLACLQVFTPEKLAYKSRGNRTFCVYQTRIIAELAHLLLNQCSLHS